MHYDFHLLTDANRVVINRMGNHESDTIEFRNVGEMMGLVWLELLFLEMNLNQLIKFVWA